VFTPEECPVYSKTTLVGFPIAPLEPGCLFFRVYYKQEAPNGAKESFKTKSPIINLTLIRRFGAPFTISCAYKGSQDQYEVLLLMIVLPFFFVLLKAGYQR
jgi:hypothetical protein